MNLPNATNLGLAGILIILSACSDTDENRISKVENGLLPVTAYEDDLGTKASIAQRLDDYGVPGVSVAIFDSGELIWARGYGVTGEENIAVTTDTLFQAASISKPVTAVGALFLVQQGHLRLEDDVNDSLKSWQIPTNGFADEHSVTLRGLLNHSAGVTVHGFPGYKRDATLPSLENVLNGQEPAITPRIEVDIPVDSAWRYSGGGYTVVQKLMVDVTEQPFPSLMADLVLGPIGMTDSTFQQPLPPKLLKSAATGHRLGIGAVPGGHHVYPEMSAAGLWTTATDLALFALNLHKSLAGQPEGILDASIASEMLTERSGNYGLGVKLNGQQQSLWASHSGINHGFDSMIVMYPELGSGAVVMVNSNLSQGLIDEIFVSVALAHSWPDYPIKEQRKTKQYSEEQLETYPGTYDLGDGSSVSVIRKGDRLFMLIPELGSTEIFSALSDDHLFVTGIAFPSFKLVMEDTGPTIQFVGP